MSTPRPRATLLAALLVPILALPLTPTLEARADGPPPLTGVTLPAPPEGLAVTDVRLDGATVYARLDGSAATAPGVYVAASDGTGDWKPVRDPRDGSVLTGTVRAADHGALLVTSDSPTTGCEDSVLLAPGVERVLCGWVDLVPGGGALWIHPSGGARSRIEHLDGTAMARGDLPADATPFMADGRPRSVVRTASSLEVADLDDAAAPVARIPLPEACLNAVGSLPSTGDIHGTEVLLECRGGRGQFDLAGIADARATTLVSLGAGFGVGRRPPGSTGITVADGGSARLTWQIDVASSWGVDASDSPRLVIATGSEVRVLTVPVSEGSAIYQDTTPPVLTRFDPPPTYQRQSRPYDGVVAWTGADPGGAEAAVGFDVERAEVNHASDRLVYRSVPGPLSGGPWIGPDQSENVGGARRGCLRVRARDWAGNTSAWRTACVTWDGSAPLVEPRYLPFVTLAGSPVTFSYRAEDELSGLADHDVQRRLHRPGRPWSAWASPAGWTHRTSRSVSPGRAAGRVGLLPGPRPRPRRQRRAVDSEHEDRVDGLHGDALRRSLVRGWSRRPAHP